MWPGGTLSTHTWSSCSARCGPMREVGLPDGRVLVHGHWGRPALVFPSEQGNAADAESNGLVGAVSGLLEAGRLKLYCVDSYDAASWSAGHLPLEERARQHHS